MNIEDQVRESNHIEGIRRDPTAEELATHSRFVKLKEVGLADLVDFVKVYQPNARLRNSMGLDVRVGSHYPPRGAPEIQDRLETLLYKARMNPGLAHEIHVEYETLHPFTDGNGRSGRALWYWCMENSSQYRLASLGFLHAFYYQTLDNSDKRK